MTILYLIAVLAINVTDSAPRMIEGINVCINGQLSGTAIFWYGLLIAFIIDLITN
ncbi:hypothetical protein [Psychrobacillus sp. OK032]|uniref:hypothetical protein n=1 Tax=Psychrobacillus sp. OK032 TaxID=1884358 RepID=UPI0015A6255A|nr:hypothetical protein [Psychrobacillus sp. OK032]